jgi:hypothetical protein
VDIALAPVLMCVQNVMLLLLLKFKAKKRKTLKLLEILIGVNLLLEIASK